MEIQLCKVRKLSFKLPVNPAGQTQVVGLAEHRRKPRTRSHPARDRAKS